jgi:hypothetical protein
MQPETLNSAAEVFNELGGNAGLEELTGSKPSTVSMWKKAGNFPTNTYLIMTQALRERGKTAPASLWGMKAKKEPA